MMWRYVWCKCGLDVGIIPRYNEWIVVVVVVVVSGGGGGGGGGGGDGVGVGVGVVCTKMYCCCR